jgi:FkbM family methyltransferase
LKRRSLAIRQILGFYERDVRNLLKRLHGDCFYDIGVNVGHYSLPLGHNFSRVSAVEPVPRNIRQLKRRLSFRFVRNIVVVPKALPDKNGTSTLYVNSDRKNILNNFSANSSLEKFESRSCNYGSDRTYVGSPIPVQTMTSTTFFQNLLQIL